AHIVHANGSFVAPNVFNKLTLDGFIGGGTIGYNYQAGSVVLGAEGDFDLMSAHDSQQQNVAYFDRLSTSIDWLATARVRAGYTFGPALVYATGGAAFAKFKSAELYSNPGYGTISNSETKIGFAIGGGVEYALTANLSVKTEYLYADFGKQSFDVSANAFPAGTTAQIDHALHIARVGLNYRF
ncbi:MAG: porin family protein, partial [Mesorhizobium sp.]